MTENKASFFSRITPCLCPSDVLKVQAAYHMAKHAHRAQVRKELDASGQPVRYFEHCRRVAIILMDRVKVMDADIIASALLHDIVEDTDDVSVEMLEWMFGERVAQTVRLCSKIPKEGFYDRLRDFGTMEALLVKAADRLDNNSHWENTTDEFRLKQVRETEWVILPILRNRISNERYGKPLSQLINLIEETVQKW